MGPGQILEYAVADKHMFTYAWTKIDRQSGRFHQKPNSYSLLNSTNIKNDVKLGRFNLKPVNILPTITFPLELPHEQHRALFLIFHHIQFVIAPPPLFFLLHVF